MIFDQDILLQIGIGLKDGIVISMLVVLVFVASNYIAETLFHIGLF